MIGKLDMTGRTIYENTAIAKLNKVIDVVNRLEESVQGVVKNSIADGGRIRLLQEQIHALKTRLENVQSDPYAEQRKWIGKACWFWDGCAKTRAFGELNQVDTEYNDAPFQTNFGQWYEHCEPVKPDDDIIYKGGDNER